jgi:predicted ATPase
MRLLALGGQRAQALAHYEAFKLLLLREVAVEPDAETRRLYERIRAEETEHSAASGRLPTPLTAFIGREQELVELSTWLSESDMRLITLLGPGGSGKTRLAIQAGRALRYEYPDGAFLVSLSGLGSPEAFLPALAHTLGVIIQPNWGDPFSQLLSYLQQRHMLLILDSFEELLGAGLGAGLRPAPTAAELVTRILQAAPHVQVLVTSRARLNVQSEQVFPLEGLPYPERVDINDEPLKLGDYPALQLFHSTARQARPDYAHTPADLPYMSRICQLVNGMPLALILAAGWMETCSPQEIATEIESSLDFLSSEWSDVPERQRSLRATLDYSWHLLTDDERQAFKNLSVFQSAFTRTAVEQVTRLNAAELRNLVDKSILQTAQGQFRMHDLVRQYAAKKLAEDPLVASRVQDAHSKYYLARVIEREPRLKSAQRSATLREIDAEINDVQAAWKWACSQSNLPLLSKSLEALALYYQMRLRYPELKTALQCALEIPAIQERTSTETAVLHAHILVWQSSVPYNITPPEITVSLRSQAVTLLDQLEAQGVDVLSVRALYWFCEGDASPDIKRRVEAYEQAILLYQHLEEPWRMAGAINNIIGIAVAATQFDVAMKYSETGARLAHLVGEPYIILNMLAALSALYFNQLNFEKLRQITQEFEAFITSLEEPAARAIALSILANIYGYNGRYTEAIRNFELAAAQLRSLGFYNRSWYCRVCMAGYYGALGEYENAAAILPAVMQESAQAATATYTPDTFYGAQTALGIVLLFLGRQTEAVRLLHESASYWQTTNALNHLGWALGGLSIGLSLTGQPEAARQAALEALDIPGNTHTLMTSWVALGLLLIRDGHLEAALRLYRVSLRMPQFRASHWYADGIWNDMEIEWQKLSAARQAEIEASVEGQNLYSIQRELRPLLEDM